MPGMERIFGLNLLKYWTMISMRLKFGGRKLNEVLEGERSFDKGVHQSLLVCKPLWLWISYTPLTPKNSSQCMIYFNPSANVSRVYLEDVTHFKRISLPVDPPVQKLVPCPSSPILPKLFVKFPHPGRGTLLSIQ